MPIIRNAQTSDFTFQLDGGATDKLRVGAFSGFEALSRPFRYHLDLVSTDGALTLQDSLGKPGLLTIHSADGKRLVHGIVSRIEQVTRGRTYSTYEADLVPSIWLLDQRANCRIFQQMSVKDIVTKVLEDGNIASDRFEFSLQKSYASREYCVQYRETDLQFISRLLEEEGIYYFFRHAADGHVLVMADNAGAMVAIGGDSKLIYRAPGGMAADKEHVESFRFSEEIRTGKVTLRDFNYLKPDTDLTVAESADRDAGLEVYDYPGLYLEESAGKTVVGMRLEEARATISCGRGEANCRRLLPGFRFTLDEFPRSDFNREYALVQVSQSGTQPQVYEEEAGSSKPATYGCVFECIPSDVAFRPDRITPKPFVRGNQTATVVGPKDEQLYMDEHGRAKVMFHWDREGKADENCTCWIRVTHGYAGSTHGIQFPPLVGDEVVVAFLEGDPDKPLIIGSVYNAKNPPPLKPEERIQNVLLTPYQHQLLFDDKKMCVRLVTGGAESLHMGDADEDKDFGNNVRLSTKDGHLVQLAKGDTHKGLIAQTEAKHTLEMRDDPNPGIFLTDMNGTIYLQLDTQNKTINLINETSAEINVKCDGGTVNVSAGEINLEAGGNVKIKAGSEISLSAPDIKLVGDGSVKAKAPVVSIEGTGQLKAIGGTTTLEGEGMATMKAGGIMTIQGSMVKIN